MADITYTQFPIEADIVDISQMQTDISNAQTDILNLGQNKADKSTTINGYSLAQNRTLYVQDFGSKNLFNTVEAGFEPRNNYGVTRSLASDGTGIVLSGLSTGTTLWARSSDNASLWLPQGEYTISYEASGTGSSSVTSFGVLTSGGQTYYSSFTAPSGGITIVNFVIVVTNNVQYNCTVYPMIRQSSAPSGYVPYAKTNVELANEVVIGAISNETGWTSDPNLTKLMKYGKVVTLSIGTTSSSAPVSQWNSIATVPFGFFPLYTLNGLVGVNNYNDDSVQFKITNAGAIQFYKKSDMTGSTSVRFCCTYICQ